MFFRGLFKTPFDSSRPYTWACSGPYTTLPYVIQVFVWAPFGHSSSIELAIIIATDLVRSFSSKISRAMMMIGAPIIAPAIPHT